MISVPFARSYWVEPGKLLAGCYPGSKRYDEAGQRLAALLDAGILRVINLMEEDETDWQGDGFEPYEETLHILADARDLSVECIRMPIRDVSVPSIARMKSILDAIDEGIGQGKPVYVHCWGGRGRTGTVVGCWLARHNRATGNAALALIQALRKNDPTGKLPSPETEEQRAMVRGWKAGQ